VELCKEPAGLFLTADANQSLYNSGFRWTYVHRDLNVQGRSRILRRNYRSTQEIADAAAEIMLAGDDGYDEEAAKQEFVHSGAYPAIYAAEDDEDQARWIARRIFEAAREMRLPPNAAAVLVSRHDLGKRLAERLNEEGLPAVFMSSREFELEDPHVKVTTLHAAKGLEFPIVVMAHVEEGHLPWEATATDEQELSEFLHGQRRLFYVGCTRAMRYLFVTYNRASPSSFLDVLSDDCWMWLGKELVG
jgi:superfamily I DNA/RNA helicase